MSNFKYLIFMIITHQLCYDIATLKEKQLKFLLMQISFCCQFDNIYQRLLQWHQTKSILCNVQFK